MYRTPTSPAITPHDDRRDAALTLAELNALVRRAIEQTLPAAFWVKAEISECRVAANGHCYLEFVEKAPRGGRLLAKASAHIWQSTFALLRPYFEQTTGSPLTAGIKVLVRVEAEFHELYGYSLNVVDIDAAYTLGDVAQRRREILRQLEDDGVLELNKELPLTHPLARIAVVSSAKAAGYGDFCTQLAQSGYGFRHELFEAVMQGDRVEESVIAALDRIAIRQEDFDVVVIIRGGGAVSDLQGFDTYELAANVAQFPLPVFSGIGHERDETVVDFVAHTRFKTPTAVAAFLVESMGAEADLVLGLQERLRSAVAARRTAERHRFDMAARRLQQAAARYASVGRERLLRLAARLQMAADRRVRNRRGSLDLLAARLERLPADRIRHEHRRLEALGRAVALAGPERILRLGFSITTKDGRPVRSAAALKPGDRLTTTLHEGSVTSIVE